jgi:hypothetical protein
MKNLKNINTEKIKKKLDHEFPGITDKSILMYIKEKEEKRERIKHGLQCLLIVLILFPFVFFAFFFASKFLEIELTIYNYIQFIIFSLVMSLSPAIISFKNP